MFLRLIPDLRRLNRWSAVSFRYAAAPMWFLKKHPVLTATPIVATFRLQIRVSQRGPRISISGATYSGSCGRDQFGKAKREGAGSGGRDSPATAGAQCFARQSAGRQSAGIRGASEGLRGIARNPNAAPQMARQFRRLKRHEVIVQRGSLGLSSRFLEPLE